MERRVVITGLGAISPVGNTVADFWNSLIEGKSGLNFIQGFDDVDLPVRIVAQVKDFDPIANGLERADVRKMDLYCQFAIAAANQAVKDSGLVSGENIEPDRFGVYVGSGIGGISTFVRETGKYLEEGARRISPLFIPTMIANIAAGNIAIRHNAQGPCLPIVTACATGTHSAGEAFRAIKYGLADAIITGGAEAAIHPMAIGGFANSRALTDAETLEDACTPFDARRSGFTMAEGAGVLVFEEYEHAVKRGATIYAEVAGYGNSCDAHHYTAPRPDGIPASKAIRMALEEAGYTNVRQLHDGILRDTPEGQMLETAYTFDLPYDNGSVMHITVVYYDCYYLGIEYIFEITAYNGDYETAQYLLDEMVKTVDIWPAGAVR